MADKKRVQKKRRKKFLEVNVWQTQFGQVSVKAIYDIYSQKFNVEKHNMKKHSFSHCVNALRLLEDENYTPPQDVNSY